MLGQGLACLLREKGRRGECGWTWREVGGQGSRKEVGGQEKGRDEGEDVRKTPSNNSSKMPFEGFPPLTRQNRRV